MVHIPKEKINIREKLQKKHLLNLIITISTILIGAIFICITIGIIQTRTSEYKQRDNCEKILAEVTETLDRNDKTVKNVVNEFNILNQTTVNTLSSYITYVQSLDSLKELANLPEDQVLAGLLKACGQFSALRDELDIGELYLIDQDGTVLVCSDDDYLYHNLKSVLSESEFETIVRNEVDSNGNVLAGGTTTYKNGIVYLVTPIIEDNYYTYSAFFAEEGGIKYYLLMSVDSALIDTEIGGLKKIENVLSGITVGKHGFLFSIDTQTKLFTYFDNGSVSLSGRNYEALGLNDNATEDSYAGYQTIDGVKYYCVTKEIQSSAYGNYTVVAAVVTKDEILAENFYSILFSCLAFILVACIVVGYGMILKRDVANHIIALQNKYYGFLKDELKNPNIKYTEEEIGERTNLRISEDIDKGIDVKLKRKNIGTRNKSGKQWFISQYILFRSAPVVALGLFVIFLFSFFSQTLISLQDVTALSKARMNEIENTLTKNETTIDVVQSYTDSQFVTKAKLLAYTIEEAPDYIFTFDAESNDCHRLFEYDENGEKYYLVDQYNNPKYSIANSEHLSLISERNNVSYIGVFDEEGNTIATTNDEWYFRLSKDEESQSYPFNAIIDGKCNIYAQPAQENDMGRTEQYIGSAFYYYTYLDETGNTRYASKTDYNSQLAGTWPNNTITRHRGMLQISVDQESISILYNVTELSYILCNLHVYGNNSFFVAFDATDDHTIVYSPIAASIGKKAEDVGIDANAFSLTGTYNGFQTVNGTNYYQSYKLIGDYYIATAVPTSSMYDSRIVISLITLGFSSILILFSAFIYAVTNDQAEKDYIQNVRHTMDNLENPKISYNSSGKRKKQMNPAARYKVIAWSDKTAEQKLSSIMMFYLSIASIFVIVMIIIAMTNASDDSIFTYIFTGNWERGVNIFSITEVTMIMIMVLTVTKVLQIVVKAFCSTLGARVETAGALTISILKYGGIIGGLIYSLYLFGLDTTSLITSAGILTLVVGLGAQSLIQDILAGIFIVFEGEFRVGDIVTIGDFRGTVIEIGLRTSKIVDATKNIKIFNNSSISGVLNMTRESSFAVIDVGIEYGESLERVENILQEAFPEIRKRVPTITDGPFYKGVSELGESSVNIKIMAQCEEKDRLQLARDLNREIFILFNKKGINIPFPQVTLSYLNDRESNTVSKAEQEKADLFVATQKAESAEIDMKE